MAGLFGRLIEPRTTLAEERLRFTIGDLKNMIIPIIIEQFFALLVGIADTLMLSQYIGRADKNNVPRYLVIDFSKAEKEQVANMEDVLAVSERLIKQNMEAYEVLAK